MGRAVPLKWAEHSWTEKWAEMSGLRSPGLKWFWTEESWNHSNEHPQHRFLWIDKQNYPKIIVMIGGPRGQVGMVAVFQRS